MVAGGLSFEREARRSPNDRGCRICGVPSYLLSETLGLCLNCIRAHPNEALCLAQSVHAESRRAFDLPAETPHATGGLPCVLCSRQCRIADSERGYCGLRTVRDGRLIHLAGTARRGVLQWYRDPLPTNCVADWVCRGSRQSGHHNLAVFYASCSLNCLFCQNWHFREVSATSTAGISAEQLADAADPSTFCVCFFGGDPAPQMPHALVAGQRLAAKGLAVCWETVGTSHPKLIDRAVELSLASGGCIKFDLKAYDEVLHLILTGGSNRQTLDNFARAARRFEERPDAPLVLASTLLWCPAMWMPRRWGKLRGSLPT